MWYDIIAHEFKGAFGPRLGFRWRLVNSKRHKKNYKYVCIPRECPSSSTTYKYDKMRITYERAKIGTNVHRY